MLFKGSFHELDSSASTFAMAAAMALTAALKRANCRLVLPIMEMDVVVPAAAFPLVSAEFARHDAEVRGSNEHNDLMRVLIHVPLPQMQPLQVILTAMTGARLETVARLHHYPNIQPPGNDNFQGGVVARL